jgi:hypothetical protein
MTLLLTATLLAGVLGWFVIHPIMARRSALIQDVTAGGVLDAEARKRVALAELKEIEYDYLGGKLDGADYQALRERVSREALAAIRAAEAIAVTGSDAPQAAAPVTPAREHACGFGNPPGSRFCAGCGAQLT